MNRALALKYGRIITKKEFTMKKLDSINVLKTILIISGVFDMFGGFFFLLLVGSNKSISNPPTDPFYAILIATFLFCLAYLQITTSFNIRRYFFNIGVVTLSRLLFVALFLYSFLSIEGFPIVFLPTAMADLIWAVLYIVLTLRSDEVRFRDLFLPNR